MGKSFINSALLKSNEVYLITASQAKNKRIFQAGQASFILQKVLFLMGIWVVQVLILSGFVLIQNCQNPTNQRIRETTAK